MPFINVRDFNLKHTLDSGQYFTYWKHDGWYYVLSTNLIFKVQQEKNKLYFHNISRKHILNFFKVEEDLGEIFKTIDKDKFIHQAISKYNGLRLIKQDPWQCIISFICSSNSNIPRIKKNINSICQKFGRKIELDRKIFHTFPSFDELNDRKKLLKCGLGYRTEYIFKSSRIVNKTFLEKLERSNYEEAKTMLLSLYGVGDKVSECILLFSLNHNQAFPVDTWIEKGILELYGSKIKSLYKTKNKSPQQIREFSQNYFGKNAGYAQQYLFHWRRHK